MSSPAYTPNIPSFLRHIASQFETNDAVVLNQQAVSYGKIERLSADLARALLAAGIGKGTRVGILFPNGIDWVVSFFAATRIGAIAIPISTFLRPVELAWTLRHADIHTLLTIDRFLNNNYAELLETAIPELAASEATPLHLTSAPYLRQVFFWGKCNAQWAKPVEALYELAKASPAIDETFLCAVEDAVTPADWLFIIYTSGSTAEPKAVIHSHSSILRHSLQQARARGLLEKDRAWLPMPLFWIGGLAFGLIGNMHMGAATILEQNPDAGTSLQLLEREQVTISLGWPHVIKAMQDHPDFHKYDLSAIRDGATPNALHPDVYPSNPSTRTIPLGMTETCGPHSYEDITQDLPASLWGSCGIPFPDVDLKIVDPESGEPLNDEEVGEIIVRGGGLMQGLYKKERESVFTKDGFYPTGDAGYVKNRRVFFTHRLGNMIKTGGANVAPLEVENALLLNTQVREAYVVGVPDTPKGQVVVAAVVLNSDSSLDQDTILAGLKGEISTFKIPRAIAFFQKSELPVLHNGKIDIATLGELLENKVNPQ